MNNDERLADIVGISDALLQKLRGYPQEDSSPEGRMISQLKWLRENARAGTLQLPVNQGDVATLRHIYTEGSLRRLANSRDEYVKKIEFRLDQLMSLTMRGAYLLKPEYYAYAARAVGKLISILQYAPRPLTPDEQASIAELQQLRTLVSSAQISPPLMTWDGYPHFRKVYSMVGSSVDDLPEGEVVCRMVANLIFNGVRPASWLTPETADRETKPWKDSGPV